MQPKPNPSRFATRFTTHELLRALRTVAEAAQAQAPTLVTQRAWDEARASTSYVGAPRARTIAQRLGLPWRDALALAFEPARTQDYRLGHHQGEPDQDWISEEHALAYLRLIAWRLKLGRTEPLTRAAYERERDRLLASDQRRYHHGRGLLVPSAHQLAAFFDDWPAALTAAGLVAGKRGGDRGPAPIGFVEALERCYVLLGAEPTCTELEVFARAQGFPLPRRAQPWPAYVTEWKQQRLARGLPVPSGPPAKRGRPDYNALTAAPADATGNYAKMRRQRKSWGDREEVLAAMIRFLSECGTTHASRRAYAAWATGRGDAPAASRLAQHGGFAAVRNEALHRLRDAG